MNTWYKVMTKNNDFKIISKDDLEIAVRINPDSNKMDILIFIGNILVTECSKSYSYKNNVGDLYSIDINRDLKTNEISIDIKVNYSYVIK